MLFTCLELTWESVGWECRQRRVQRNPQKVNLFCNVLSQSVQDMELLTNGFNISFSNNRMMDSSPGWIRIHVNSFHTNEKGVFVGRRGLSQSIQVTGWGPIWQIDYRILLLCYTWTLLWRKKLNVNIFQDKKYNRVSVAKFMCKERHRGYYFAWVLTN